MRYLAVTGILPFAAGYCKSNAGARTQGAEQYRRPTSKLFMFSGLALPVAISLIAFASP
jgi:hypothetical protein